MENNKKEPWRIAAFIIGVLCIIYMFVTKNSGADTTLTAEQAAVTVIKFAAIAAVAFLGKFIIGKIKNKKKE